VLDVERDQLRPPKRPRVPEQQQRAIARRRQIVGHGHQQRREPLEEERLLLLRRGSSIAAVPSQQLAHQRMIGRRLEACARVAACDRGQPPAQRREGKAYGPGADARRRAAAAGLERFEVERERLWRRWQRF